MFLPSHDEIASKEDDASNSSLMDHFSCKICLEILSKPVQCQRNEHYFCTLCITKHLKQSQTCPLCMDGLTEETLRPPSRIVADLLSQFKVPRCNNAHRGCKEVVTPEDLPLHHEVCGFAAVVCSNKGCGETVNRQDQSSHENESCKFGKVKCEACEEEMVYRDHETHRCFMRKEIDEVKSCLTAGLTQLKNEMSEMKDCLKEIQEQVKINTRSMDDLQDPLRNVIPSSLIFVAGGAGCQDKSFEVFNWSTKTWTMHKDVFFYPHQYSFCFPYKNYIMVCGGSHSNRIEYLNIKKDPITSHAFPVLSYNTSTNEMKELAPLPYGVSNMATVPYKDNVIVLGGQDSYGNPLDNVIMYNITNEESEKLPSMVQKISGCAAVILEDVIVVMGGKSSRSTEKTAEYLVLGQDAWNELPPMHRAREGATATVQV